MRLPLLFMLGLALGLAGSLGWAWGGGSMPGAASAPSTAPLARSEGSPDATAPPVSTAGPTPEGQTPEPCTDAPLATRAQQVLVVGLPAVTDADDPAIAAMLGDGVGGVFISKANVADGAQVRSLVEALRARQEAPLLVATDEEPGRVSSFGALLGRTSSARTLAARTAPEDTRAFARDMGAALAGYGIDADLAPVADLDDGPAGGVIGDRSFSADPATATAHALAFARGLADAGVAPTVKHFPGHGRSRTDSHRELDLVEAPLTALEGTDLVPFAAAIDAGVPLVMTAHVAYADIDSERPASLAAGTYSLLRDMGFQGVAITDSIGMGAVNLRWPFPEAAVMAIEAGADAVLATDGNHTVAMRDALVDAVRSGRLPEARLDQAAARMVAVAGGDPASLVCGAEAAVPTSLLPAAGSSQQEGRG